MALTAGGHWLRGRSPDSLQIVIVLVMFGLYVLVAAFALDALPHADAPLRALLPGAFLLAFSQQVLQLAVVLYLAPKLGRSPQVYGALGAATVILLWLYIVARMVVAAAFLNASLWYRHEAEASSAGGTIGES